MIKDDSRSIYDIEIRVNFAGFFVGKFHPELVLVLGLELPAGRDCAGAEFCGGFLCG